MEDFERARADSFFRRITARFPQHRRPASILITHLLADRPSLVAAARARPGDGAGPQDVRQPGHAPPYLRRGPGDDQEPRGPRPAAGARASRRPPARGEGNEMRCSGGLPPRSQLMNYQSKITRQIPVVALNRRAQTAPTT
jgi:hypothetical protein